MSELDDAIREHLELKRRHGAREQEVQQLEEEAFGSAERPADPFSAADALLREGGGEGEKAAAAERPEGGPAPEASAVEAPEAPSDEAPADDAQISADAEPALPSGDTQIPPPPPQSADRPGEVVDRPTEEHPPPEPPSEEEVGTPPGEDSEAAPALYDFESAAAEPEEERGIPEAEPGVADDDAFADLGPAEEGSESLALDELDEDSGPGAVTADTGESTVIEEEEEAEQHPVADDEPEELYEDAGTEGPDPDEAVGPAADPAEEAPPQGEDLLEETPDFLKESPEDEDLWFEQKAPQDFDFEDEGDEKKR